MENEDILTGGQGRCPVCGSYDLEYNDIEHINHNNIYYPFTCNNCGTIGKEWFTLVDGITETEKELLPVQEIIDKLRNEEQFSDKALEDIKDKLLD